MALTTNLLYYYKLDGDSVDSVASANGSDTDITYSAGNGKIVQGAGFNGSTSQILLPNNDWSQSTGYSISAWVKTSASTDQIIVARDNASGTGRMFVVRIELTSGKAEFYRFDSSTNLVTDIKSASAYNDGNWHHIVATFDNTIGSTIYVDGSSVASDAVTTNNVSGANSSPYIGRFNGSSSPMNGAIDEVAIWNRGITSAEVTQLYNGGTGIQYPFPYTLTASVGTFTYTGYASILTKAIVMIASAGSFILTGISATFRLIGWTNQSKNNSTWTNQDKN